MARVSDMTFAVASPPASEPQRLGPLELQPGVSRGHLAAFAYAAFMTVGLLVFVAVGTPYVLNAILHLPTEAQGRVSGDLAFWTEVTLLLVFTPFGVLADRIGRPPVYALGFVLMAAGYALYPLADSVEQLVLYRIVYAVGIGATGGMLATVLSDYPRERSRGKLVALTGMLNGLGIVAITLVFGALPRQLVARGGDPVQAGRITHAAVAALCLVSAVVVLLGLKPGLPVRREERPGGWRSPMPAPSCPAATWWCWAPSPRCGARPPRSRGAWPRRRRWHAGAC
jgi:MFS family permease